MIVKNIFDYCPSRRLQACYASFQRSKYMMSIFKAKHVKIGAPAKFAGIFVTCSLLASCSSDQNAFFAQRDALISQGYTWQKLDRCRPPKDDALSFPVLATDGRKLVCYKLMPSQNATAASIAAKNPAAPSLAITPNNSSGTSGVSWDFSNFWEVWCVIAKCLTRDDQLSHGVPASPAMIGQFGRSSPSHAWASAANSDFSRCNYLSRRSM